MEAIIPHLLAQNIWQLPEANRGIYATLVVLGAFVLVLGLIPVLQALPPRGRRAIVVTVTFLAGLLFAAEFFLPVDWRAIFPKDDPTRNFLTPAIQPAQNVLQTIGALALGLGTYGLVRLHLRNVVQRRTQWGYSVVLLVAFLTMATFSIANTLAERQLLKLEGTPQRVLERGFTILFDYTLVQLDAAMFSLIAFYIFSAAYRAFRIRSIEASILMFTAMVVMIGVVPLGAYISYQLLGLPQGPAPEGAGVGTQIIHSLDLPDIANWILFTLNAPAQRAIEFGVGIGGLAMAIRLWLSLERGVT